MLIKKDGVFIREGTYDIRTLQEVKRSYGWMTLAGKDVLDIGACFGSFTCHALQRCANHVIAVEPDPGNYKLLERNVRHNQWGDQSVQLYKAAVTANGLQRLTLWRTTSGKSHGNYSTTYFRGRKGIQVRGMDIHYFLGLKPQVIKMDCEGAEYELLLGRKLPSCVKQIAVEIHLNKKEWREQWHKLVDQFSDWECVKEPYDTGKNWATVGGWRR